MEKVCRFWRRVNNVTGSFHACVEPPCLRTIRLGSKFVRLCFPHVLHGLLTVRRDLLTTQHYYFAFLDGPWQGPKQRLFVPPLPNINGLRACLGPGLFFKRLSEAVASFWGGAFVSGQHLSFANQWLPMRAWQEATRRGKKIDLLARASCLTVSKLATEWLGVPTGAYS